jgi:hypothetical protein
MLLTIAEILNRNSESAIQEYRKEIEMIGRVVAVVVRSTPSR